MTQQPPPPQTRHTHHQMGTAGSAGFRSQVATQQPPPPRSPYPQPPKSTAGSTGFRSQVATSQPPPPRDPYPQPPKSTAGSNGLDPQVATQQPPPPGSLYRQNPHATPQISGIGSTGLPPHVATQQEPPPPPPLSSGQLNSYQMQTMSGTTTMHQLQQHQQHPRQAPQVHTWNGQLQPEHSPGLGVPPGQQGGSIDTGTVQPPVFSQDLDGSDDTEDLMADLLKVEDNGDGVFDLKWND
ncbi:hypothetical protein BJ508DRAFT_334703 [Ascobolus immersus RN42]|uniref:Uncharacterized protein n=1 Tax=Ascobolus immersus RN42 TaxID=1160509 RepID=A0A3N4HJP9_ASCIM|nr:hypothetical protein BJ508DRAFT_334703 [Ascobolus immersus RN42]